MLAPEIEHVFISGNKEKYGSLHLVQDQRVQAHKPNHQEQSKGRSVNQADAN
jgi:hypothetical protein